MAIASCLVDTNILLRIARRSDPQHKLVDAALAKLSLAGTTLHYTHQNIAPSTVNPILGIVPTFFLEFSCPRLRMAVQ